MDARVLRSGILLTAIFTSTGASYRTPNFTVHAPSERIARQVGRAAERYRLRLAEQWLGHRLQNWSKPCPVKVKVGRLGAGGRTTFQFSGRRVFNWDMQVQGSLERILDSVLPHEITHTVLASHFRRPLPRWADEGASTLCEHHSERSRQTRLLDQVIRSRRRFPMRALLTMTEYPSDMRRVLTMYAQGYSLTDFLVQQGGRRRFLKFLADAHRIGWNRAIERNYNHQNADAMEKHWQSWFLAGSPKLTPPDQLLAATTGTRDTAKPAVTPLPVDDSDGPPATKRPETRIRTQAAPTAPRPGVRLRGVRADVHPIRPTRTTARPRSVFCILDERNSDFLPGGRPFNHDQFPCWSWSPQLRDLHDFGSTSASPYSP